MTAEDCLPECLHVWNPFVERDHDREPPSKQNANRNYKEPPDTQRKRLVIELFKRHPSTNKDESGDVEEEINDGAEDGLLGLFVEESVPREGSTTSKRGQEIVRAKKGRDANSEHRQRNVLRDVGLPVNEVLPLAEFHKVSEPVTN